MVSSNKKVNSVQLKYKTEDITKVRELIKKNHLNKNIILCHIITPLKERTWDMDKWSELLMRLIDKFDSKILLIGSEKDKANLDSLNEKVNNKLIVIAGELNLIQLRLLMEKANLFIGSGSGPMYLCETTDTPIIGIMGPLSPPKWNLYKKDNLVIRSDDLGSLNVDEVYDKIITYLNNHPNIIK